MKREKTPKLVLTFPNTTSAMAAEAACGAALGRLIPIPGEIRGGCGLAWCALPEQEAEVLGRIEEKGILYEEKRIIELY